MLVGEAVIWWTALRGLAAWMGVFQAPLPRLTARRQFPPHGDYSRFPLRTEPPLVRAQSPSPKTQQGPVWVGILRVCVRVALCLWVHCSPGFSPRSAPWIRHPERWGPGGPPASGQPGAVSPAGSAAGISPAGGHRVAAVRGLVSPLLEESDGGLEAARNRGETAPPAAWRTGNTAYFFSYLLK